MDINELVHHFRYKVNKITLKIIIIIVALKTNYIIVLFIVSIYFTPTMQ